MRRGEPEVQAWGFGSSLVESLELPESLEPPGALALGPERRRRDRMKDAAAFAGATDEPYITELKSPIPGYVVRIPHKDGSGKIARRNFKGASGHSPST